MTMLSSLEGTKSNMIILALPNLDFNIFLHEKQKKLTVKNLRICEVTINASTTSADVAN